MTPRGIQNQNHEKKLIFKRLHGKLVTGLELVFIRWKKRSERHEANMATLCTTTEQRQYPPLNSKEKIGQKSMLCIKGLQSEALRDDGEKSEQAVLLFTRESEQNSVQVQSIRGDGTSNRDVLYIFPVTLVAGNAGLLHPVS